MNGTVRSCTNVQTGSNNSDKLDELFCKSEILSEPPKYKPKRKGAPPLLIPNGLPTKGLTPEAKRALQVFVFYVDDIQAETQYVKGAIINSDLCAKIAGVHRDTMRKAIRHAIKKGVIEIVSEYSHTPNGTSNRSRTYRLTEKYATNQRTLRPIKLNIRKYVSKDHEITAAPTQTLDYTAPEALEETRSMRSIFISLEGALKYLKRDRTNFWHNDPKHNPVKWEVNEEEYYKVMTSNHTYLNLAKAIERGEIIHDIKYIKDPSKQINAQKIRRAIASIMYRVYLLNNRIEIPPAGKCPKTNRIFSPFNQLPREIRNAAYDFTHTTKSHRLLEADIRNSHPLLLSIQMSEAGIPGSFEMLQDCKEGIFHDKVMERAGISNKEQVYKPLLNHFLYGRPFKSNEAYWSNPIRDIIAQTYSKEIVKYIDQFKRDKGHKTLPNSLMKREAGIILHALKQLRAMHPRRLFFSVHDAIAFTDCDQGQMKETVVKAIENTYLKYYNVKPSIRVK